jgi:hypothetical protein
MPQPLGDAAPSSAQPFDVARQSDVDEPGVLHNAGTSTEGAELPHKTTAAPSVPFYPTGMLMAAMNCSRPTLLSIAKREAWLARQGERGFEFVPPANLLALLPPPPGPRASKDEPKRIGYFELKDELQRELARRREVVVKDYSTRLQSHFKGEAKEATQYRFATLETPTTLDGVTFNSPVPFTIRTLEIWVKNYAQHGLDGLCDQRQRGGRKPTEVPREIAAWLKAKSIEHGSVAKAMQLLATDPDLPASMRDACSAAFASKSYVRPSVRRAATPSRLTTTLAAQGPRAARLSGRFSPGVWSNTAPGSVFVSDDMTSNVLVWVEDLQSPLGYRIGQPQILPVMDVGSLRWLNVRCIMRPGGQYNALDDIAGLFGDVFDTFGLPTKPDGTPGAFLLEGGHWQSNAVIGHRTGLADGDRIGGLASLGIEVIRSYEPKSKGMLEGAFHHFQHWVDAYPGFGGRDQRKELPELVKKQLALCKGGHAHPRQFFPHLREFSNHVQTVMENMNQMRNDGQICRGATPLEKWMDSPALLRVPESSRWMYRSALSITKITRNGVRVTMGSGAKLLTYYYDRPEVLTHFEGTKVRVYWNHTNPESDAIILDHASNGFLCSASKVDPLNYDVEKQRKALAMQVARTELRSIQPHMARRTMPIATDDTNERLSNEIAQAHAREATKRAQVRQSERAVQTAIRNTPVTLDDVNAVLATDTRPDALTDEDFAALLGADKPVND